MYPVPPTETLVETKTCKHCGVSFPITDKDLEFYEKVSPVFQTPPNLPLSGEGQISPPDKGDKGGFRYLIPSPTLCPDCRQQRRLSFRNERKLYKRRCDLTGKDIVSIFSPDKPFKVYEQSEWWSDKWNPLDYGRDFDFDRSFFEQFEELMKNIPLYNTTVVNSENSDYTNFTANCKNCYLLFTGSSDEDCLYGNFVVGSKGCMDCNYLKNSEHCYSSFDLENCNEILHGSFLLDCANCFYCSDCKSCKNCIGCVGLKDKEYYILNKQVSKEDFDLKVREIQKLDKSKFDALLSVFPKKNVININSNNISGDWLNSCENCFHCYDLKNSIDCKFIERLDGVRGSMDCFSVKDADLTYECMTVGAPSYNNLFSNTCWPAGNNLSYCNFCFNSSFLFGCIGLRNKSYCIFNKQYTREEWELLVPKIIEHMKKTGEWGEFFPSSLSPFGYNETVSNEWFPLTREQALEKGFKWSDYENPFPKVDKIIPASKLPDDITKIPDDILNWAIECEVTKTRGGNPLFRITKQELEFYRKHNLPIPRRHPDQRHLDRMALRNPRKLFERKCDKCGVEMMTTFAPERPEIVYCESCYNKEIL